MKNLISFIIIMRINEEFILRCMQPSFISGNQDYLNGRPLPHVRPCPLPKVTNIGWLINGRSYSADSFTPDETSQKGHVILRLAVASVDNAFQLNFPLYPVLLWPFLFHRCWFQELSLINVCFLTSITESVFGESNLYTCQVKSLSNWQYMVFFQDRYYCFHSTEEKTKV